jgi:hypothetical protein
MRAANAHHVKLLVIASEEKKITDLLPADLAARIGAAGQLQLPAPCPARSAPTARRPRPGSTAPPAATPTTRNPGDANGV